MPRIRKSFNRKSQRRDPRTFYVVASEGAVTEVRYFNALKGLCNSKIFLEVLERSTGNAGNSSAESVLAMLDGYRDAYVLEEEDELWLLVDRDPQSLSAKTLGDVFRKVKQKGYNLAVSTPCFEYWLLLHVWDSAGCSEGETEKLVGNRRVNTNRSYIELKLKELLGGYNKRNPPVERLIPLVNLAVQRASDEDISPDQPWVDGQLGTKVYLLVQKLLQP